jgi:DHA2 family multidrug resistance protein-like MFS transporter
VCGVTEPRPRQGQQRRIASISEASSELGGALGIAILGSIGTAAYRTVMATASLATLAPETAQAARDTLGGAVATAQLLSNGGAELLGIARQAFARSLETVAAVSAVVVLAAAITVVVMLRSIRTGAEGETERTADLRSSDEPCEPQRCSA